MAICIVDSAHSAEHVTPAGHPEHTGRYNAVRDAVLSVADTVWLESRPADPAEILRFHTPEHVARIMRAGEAAGPGGWSPIDADTGCTGASPLAAQHAAGAAIRAVDHVLAGHVSQAFCLARPPGHHAEPDRPMGFCLFNTIAIAALHALETAGLERVAIIDIDVHHGNGSQVLAEQDPRVMFVSLHQAPLYPGTGMAGETGLNGNILNIPLPAGTTGQDWLDAYQSDVPDRLRRFAPQLVLVSAGFDAHTDDPLAGFDLQDADYRAIGEQLAALAQETVDSRLVSVLEGGYDCPALGRSVTAFLKGLAGAR